MQNTQKSQNIILVAGGMGVAPLVAWAEDLAKKQSKHRCSVLLGAKTKQQVLCIEEFRKLGLGVRIATEDGSKGHKGYVTDLLKKFLLSNVIYQPSTIYACGPKAMLESIVGLIRERRIFCQASLEENMACGVGACLGCAISTKRGYKLVCKDGPVFDLQEIKW